MKLSNYLIIIILVSIVITCIYAFEIDLASNPAWVVTINTSYSNTYNKVDRVMNHTNETYAAVLAITSAEDKQFFTGIWDIITITKDMIIDSITLPINLITDFSADVGFPSIVVAGLITIITILVIASVIFLVVKRKW